MYSKQKRLSLQIFSRSSKDRRSPPPPPPPPRSSSKKQQQSTKVSSVNSTSPPPLPPKSSTLLTTVKTVNGDSSVNTHTSHNDGHHNNVSLKKASVYTSKSTSHLNTNSANNSMNTASFSDLKAIQKQAVLEFYLKQITKKVS